MRQQDIETLVLWYQKNKRDLPWRHTKDAYKIWISEYGNRIKNKCKNMVQ